MGVRQKWDVILPSGAYVTLYKQDCSHYEMRENKSLLSCGFAEAIHIIVKMPPSSSVENCSKTMRNHNQIWIFIFFRLVSNDVSVDCKHLVGHNRVLSFFTPSCSTSVCEGSVFLQFCDKIQSRMHQVSTQMYLSFYRTVTHGKTHGIFYKEILLSIRCDGYPIFPHLNLPPDKNPSKQVHAILPSSSHPPKQVQKTHETSR